MDEGPKESLMTEERPARQPRPKLNMRRKTAIVIILFVLSIITAFVVGMVAGIARVGEKMEMMMSMMHQRRGQGQKEKTLVNVTRDDHKEIVEHLKAANMREDLRYLSMKPHSAGLPRNDELGENIFKRFESYGFRSERNSYNVLLSYPRKDMPNFAHIVDKNGTAVFTTQKMESVLVEDENTTEAVQPYNSYSPAKTVEGDLVYVNYGSVEDFQALKEKYNVSCAGKIVIMRYGKLFRGDKVKHAQSNGAIGVLLYSDPQDYGPVPEDQLFPNSWWLPRDGIQTGSIDIGDGDPLTPGYPSTDQAYRINPYGKMSDLPRIPSHPISARDAAQFLSKMGGTEIKDKAWMGGLGITYRTGPGFMGNHTNLKVKVEVHNKQEQMKITNIIGTIKGTVEPDRYVILGNHRDAWIFGANDASSGTAVMMEVARALGEQMKKGWRPRRSIMFCSWDGEEFDIIGSSEWVEHHIKLLTDRAVAYLNLDTSVSGNYSLTASSSPLAYSTIIDASSKTMDPNEDTMTVLDKYIKAYPSKSRPNFPSISNLGSGSDFVFFYQLAGVPSVDFTYAAKDSENYKWFFPVYHSRHETFHWMTKFADPMFKTHLALAQVMARCLLKIADSPLIPWVVKDYAIELKNGLGKFKDLLNKFEASKYNVSTKYLEYAIGKFEEKADQFHKSLESKDLSNPLTLRMINDRLMQLEKGFILAEGMPGRPSYKHLIYAPAAHNSYGSTVFAGVTDRLYGIKDNPQQWEGIHVQLSILATRLEAVAEILDDDL